MLGPIDEGPGDGRPPWFELVLPSGIEPPTPSLPRTCSTTELRQRCSGSPSQYNEGPELGKDWPVLDRAGTRHHAGAMRSDKPGPTLGEAGHAARQTRKQRLVEALRENLRKRKAQARERAAPDPSTSTKSKQS